MPDVRLRTTSTGERASYLIRDHLGSVRAIYHDAGAPERHQWFRPFGEQVADVHAGQITDETIGWIGERYDADAGLQYLNARYYDPALGLFIQPDWFEVTKPGVGTNRYSYSFNDPVNLKDPGGNSACGCGVDVAVGAGALAIALGVTFTVDALTGSNLTKGLIDSISGLFSSKENLPQTVSTPAMPNGPSIVSTPSAADDLPNLTSTPLPDNIIDNIVSTPAAEQALPSIVSTPIDTSLPNITVVEARSQLRGALGIPKGHSDKAHHNIPHQHRNHPVVQAAIRAGFKFDGRDNGTRVVGQAGGHPQLNSRIERELDALAGLGLTDDESRSSLEDISNRERDTIENDWGGFVRNE